MKILAIDPGDTTSGYAVMDGYKPIRFGCADNEYLLNLLEIGSFEADAVIIEMVASYGMSVGKEVFETCVWIGRFWQAAKKYSQVDRVYRLDEKMAICHDSRAKDTNIRQALIDRFAQHDFKNGKGTKKNPDFFYGFSKDMWAAFAAGVAWLDKQKEAANGL